MVREWSVRVEEWSAREWGESGMREWGESEIQNLGESRVEFEIGMSRERVA